MTLRATLFNHKADKSVKGKSNTYYNASDNLKDKGNDKDQNLEDDGKYVGINAKKESKSHDFYDLMVIDYFLNSHIYTTKIAKFNEICK